MAVAQEMGKGRRKSKPRKWIQKARARMEAKGTVGSLRKATGAKKGKPIPTSKLHAAKAKGGLMAKKAQFAINMRKIG